MMNKKSLIEQILKIEWDMFATVNNEGGKAACQMDPATFRIMRTSQYATWSEELLDSYLADVTSARDTGRNLMTEKYARMMESTFPDEYARIAGALPPLDPSLTGKVDAIVAAHIQWKEALDQRYPHLGDRNRPIRTKDDKVGLPSVETYTRAEVQTYSAKTVDLYHAAIMDRLQKGTSEAEENLLNQVREYGFDTLEAAEAYFSTHE